MEYEITENPKRLPEGWSRIRYQGTTVAWNTDVYGGFIVPDNPYHELASVRIPGVGALFEHPAGAEMEQAV